MSMIMAADKISENGDEHFNISTKVQLSGVLFKRPFGHHSNKWSKRFFLVKEGFLLYYPENEKKVFEKRGYFNIHPKGVIPLGGCTVDGVSDIGQQYALHIKSDEFNNGLVALAADNLYERDKWIQILQEASRITWKNTLLGEELIRELETQGLQLCRERQDYFDKLQEETIALRDEIDRNEELEKITSELDNERKKLEAMMQQLKEEHESIRREYEETIQAMKLVQDDKLNLQRTTDDLQSTLQELATERAKTVEALRKQQAENCKLSETQDELQNTLRMIEEETKLLLEEKTEIEQRFQENEMRAQVLSEEKQIISEHAITLQTSLQDLLVQKELTEAELKEEILARIDAEKHLRSAEDSLHHLEAVIHLGGCNISDGIRKEILPDVKRLKRFFEDVAEEAKIDANKPIIMKNAVLARKKYAQLARSQRIQMTRNEKAKSLGIVLDDSSAGRAHLRRSLSTIVTEKSSLNDRFTLRRSMSTKPPQPCRQTAVSCENESDANENRTSTGKASETCEIYVAGEQVRIRRKLSTLGENE